MVVGILMIIALKRLKNHRSWLYGLITRLTIASDALKSQGFQTNNISNSLMPEQLQFS